LHAENPAAQQRGLEFLQRFESEAPPSHKAIFAAGIEHSQRFREIITRFGRFPHRNSILGRSSTPEELQFLADESKGSSSYFPRKPQAH
jgi:uncharacterized protein (DUF924 family)